MNKDSKLQELASRLVEREVIYCVSSLISDLTKIASNCPDHGTDLDYDDLLNICVKDDWETPGSWFIQNDADMDDLEKIADDNGYWSEVLSQCGVPGTVQLETHSVCTDCHLTIQIPEPDPDTSEERLKEVEACITQLPSDFHYRGERYDEEFSTSRCDCCGSTLGGARFSYTDLTDESVDIDERIKATSDPEATTEQIRDAVEALVTDDDSWREVCESNRIDPEQREAYAHWIVSNWLARKLSDRGEMVGEVMGLTIWGRCTTGQAISMDYGIQQIAAELWPEDLED